MCVGPQNYAHQKRVISSLSSKRPRIAKQLRYEEWSHSQKFRRRWCRDRRRFGRINTMLKCGGWFETVCFVQVSILLIACRVVARFSFCSVSSNTLTDANFNRSSSLSKLPNRHGFLLTLGLRFLSFFKNILVDNFGKVVDRELRNPNTSLASYIRIYALIVMCLVWGQTM
jgi:hypothetical protein